MLTLAAEKFRPAWDFMATQTFDATVERVREWSTASQNIQSKEYAGYVLRPGVDGGGDPTREVTHITLRGPAKLDEHVHLMSDALIIVVGGTGKFVSNGVEYMLREGNRVAVPRGLPHGFNIDEGEELTFISIQSPPILGGNDRADDFEVL